VLSFSRYQQSGKSFHKSQHKNYVRPRLSLNTVPLSGIQCLRKISKIWKKFSESSQSASQARSNYLTVSDWSDCSEKVWNFEDNALTCYSRRPINIQIFGLMCQTFSDCAVTKETVAISTNCSFRAPESRSSVRHNFYTYRAGKYGMIYQLTTIF